MRYKTVSLILSAALFLMAFQVPLFAAATASGISLDGSFNDWADKPQLADPTGDEVPARDITMVKWFPDTTSGNLYLYCERLGTTDNGNNDNNGNGNGNGNKDDDRYDDNYIQDNQNDDDVYQDAHINMFNGIFRFKFWFFSVSFSSDVGQRNAYVFYHPASRKVYVFLFDNTWRYLWSSSGKWGDDKDTAKKVEFYVPFSYIVGSTASGYKLDMHFNSGSDRAPNSGEITVSTISTFPIQASSALIALAAVTFFIQELRKRKLYEGF